MYSYGLYWTGLVSLALVFPAVLPVGQDNGRQNLEQRIETYLATGGHADHVGPDFAPALVRDLAAAPDEVRQELRLKIVTLDAYLVGDAQRQMRQRHALRLYALCCEEGRDLAAERLRSVMKQHPLNLPIKTGWALSEEGEKYERTRRAIYGLRRTVLETLGQLGDDRVLPEALTLVGKAESATRSDSLRFYLTPVLSANQPALSRVKQALQDQTSPVFENESLTKLVRQIEQQGHPQGN